MQPKVGKMIVILGGSNYADMEKWHCLV